MDIVINSSYGGFGLSHKAVMRYAELKGIKLYPYMDEISKEIYGEKATLDNDKVDIHYTTVPWEQYEQILEEERKKPIEPGRFAKSSSLYFSDRNILRDDLLLIQVVNELGEQANGRFASLKIIEIPDGVDWEIEEYDGSEWIAEKHKRWS